MPVDRTALTNARVALQAQRRALVDALYQDDLAAQALLAAQRQFATNSTAYAQAFAQKNTADGNRDTAHAAVAAAQASLTAAIVAWLGQNDQNADIARLEASAPIVLFPIRMETRFETSTLNVRVYPDEILLNSHETALTQAEYAAGQKYYQDLNSSSGAPSEQDDWRQMVLDFGSQRAAYILRVMLPTFGGQTSSGTSMTIPTGQNDPLIFPTDIQFRPSSLTRPTEAVLPDRWVVMTRRGNVRKFFLGAAIPEPLAMTVDPGHTSAQESQLPNGYTVDDAVRWTVDFARAVQVGMGISIPLTAQEAQFGFDRVLVFGVKTSLSAADTSVALEQLMDAHHYTRGFALLRQGSATAGTQDDPTAYPPADDAALQSFAIERGNAPTSRLHAIPSLPRTSDGYFWTKLLGVPSGVLQNVDRALEREHERAMDMNTVLWPVTYGSFLRFMMSPIFTDQAIGGAKLYFINNVFPRGPAPAFRVGSVPYGILPVASLTQWQPRGIGTFGDEAVEAALLDPLRRLVPIWKNASQNVDRILPNSPNPQIDLAKVLSLHPSSREVRLRYGLGEFLTFDIFALLGWDIEQAFSKFDLLTSDLFQRIGHPEWRHRLGRMAFQAQAGFVTNPLVDLDANLSEATGLSSDYLNGIASASISDLVNGTAATKKPSPDSLLYELLRVSTLTEYALQADLALLGTAGYAFPWLNYEVWGLTNVPTSAQSIINLLLTMQSFKGFATLEQFVRSAAQAHLAALMDLAGTPTAELDRLLSETLDVASHRLDAWVTAFATRRVFALRSLEENTSMTPVGSFFGGYAWVENLVPTPRASGTGPDGQPAEVDPTNGGFIHAPSSTHAMAAAVMRSAFLSRSPESPQKCAFDLSSRRVRSATALLDEVRNGRAVGEVLGYLFERGLQEGHPGVAGLNALRFTFRNLFPLVAGKNGIDTAQPANLAAARSVVDGLALYRAFKAGTINFSGNLPTPGTPAYNAIIAELNNLDQLMDATGDLLTGEAIFQHASGNVVGALPSLDNLVSGGHPPNPSIAQSPRAGRGLTHRIAYVFEVGALPSLSPNWASSPRALAEPALNAWVGAIVGDPANVSAQVTFDGVSPATGLPVSLKDLALSPLDLLALAGAIAQPNQAGLLDARIIVQAIGDDTTKTNVVVNYGLLPGLDPRVYRTIPDVVELLGTLVGALAGARPLAVDDLLSPADQTTALPMVEPTSLANANELLQRASAARTTLDMNIGTVSGALSALDPNNPSPLRSALRTAAQIAPERAFATSGASASALSDAATALLSDFALRAAAADAAKPALTATSEQTVQGATAMLQAIFGPSFFALPQVASPNEPEIDQALTGQAGLLPGGSLAVGRFLQQAMHGRTQLAKYRKFSLYARALGANAPTIEVVQLPFVPGETWLGLLGPPPTQSRLSLVLLSQGPLDPSVNWAGVVLDSWTEVIPDPKQPTSVAFNFNTPRANAPQSVLVVAPSSAGTNWTATDLVASLEETLDLAKVRAVDRDLLDVGQALPAILIPSSLDRGITTSSGALAQTVLRGPAASKGFS